MGKSSFDHQIISLAENVFVIENLTSNLIIKGYEGIYTFKGIIL